MEHAGSRAFEAAPGSRAVHLAVKAPRTIVIVGAGFSGTVLAVNLLRQASARPTRVVLVDRGQFARGLAYARRAYPYLLNVPAERMSASSRDPAEFLSFARRHVPAASAGDFLPRELYGQYLEALLVQAERSAPAHLQLQRVKGEAIAVERVHRARTARVHLADGRSLGADTIVLALGNPPPGALRGAELLEGRAPYIADPWAAAPGFRPGETVLVVGTGLTMVDIVLAGNQAARGKAVIHAISRHGLVPARQTPLPHVQDEDGEALIRAAAVSLPQLVRAARARADDMAQRYGDWRAAIAFLRGLAPRLWQQLARSERRRFLRHLRSLWDVHRHRLPESSWSQITELRRTGALHLHAGQLLALERVGARIRATWKVRGGNSHTTLLVDKVVNCTGPDYDVRRSRDRLVRALLAQRMAAPDALGLGLLTGPHGALIDAAGATAGDLYYLGPMLRATLWETTAVQELRVHAEELAHHLVGRPEARSQLSGAELSETAGRLLHHAAGVAPAALPVSPLSASPLL